MDLKYESLALILRANNGNVPFGLTDDNLFQVIKGDVANRILNLENVLEYFGLAPDNDSDAQEELLQNGVFYRLIAPDHLLGIDTDATHNEIKKAYLELLHQNFTCWCSIFIEEAGKKTQYTIEILYK